jgi:hypothetical protein
MDKAKHLMEKMEELKDRSEKRNYIYRNYTTSVISRKEENVWKVEGKLELAVSEELDNPDSVIEVPFEVMITDEDYGEAISTAFFNLNFIPQQFKDAVFEEDFFDLLNKAQQLVDEEENEPKETVLM